MKIAIYISGLVVLCFILSLIIGTMRVQSAIIKDGWVKYQPIEVNHFKINSMRFRRNLKLQVSINSNCVLEDDSYFNYTSTVDYLGWGKINVCMEKAHGFKK
jgi:hypothetical protein